MQKKSIFGPFCDDIPVEIAAKDAKLGLDKLQVIINKLTKQQRFFMLLSMNSYNKILLKRVFLPFFVWNCKNAKMSSNLTEPRVNVYMQTMLKKIFD